MRPVILWGYYGSNYGDDIAMEVLIEHLKKKCRLILASRFYKINEVASRHGIQYEELLRDGLKIKDRICFGFKWRKAIHVWGAGTSFTNNEGCGNADPFLFFKLFRARYGYVGSGIDQIKNKKRKIISWVMLNACDFGIFREEESLNLARSYSFTNRKCFFQGEDIVYAYLYQWIKKHEGEERKATSPYILVCPRKLRDIVGEKSEIQLRKYLCEALNQVSKRRKLSVYLLATDSTVDSECVAQFASELKKEGVNVIVIKDHRTNTITEYIAGADLVISGRLHISLLAEYLSAGVITLSYGDKILRLYEQWPDGTCIDLHQSIPSVQTLMNIANSRLSKPSRRDSAAVLHRAKNVHRMLKELDLQLQSLGGIDEKVE